MSHHPRHGDATADSPSDLELRGQSRFMFRCYPDPAFSFTVEPGQLVTVGRTFIGLRRVPQKRRSGCGVDVALPHPAVSREHIRVKNDGGGCHILTLSPRCGVPILRAADRARLSQDRIARITEEGWFWGEYLRNQVWQPLTAGDLIALPGHCFEVVSLPVEPSPESIGQDDTTPSLFVPPERVPDDSSRQT